MALSEAIKARRQALKLSQEYVADQLGISRQAVAKWEAGSSTPTADSLARLADLFEMSVSELVHPAAEAREAQAQEDGQRTRRKNARLLAARWGGVILVNAGWDGYSSGLYSPETPFYWLVLLGLGLCLMLFSSRDMARRHRLTGPQIALGAAMIISIFLLPGQIPADTGVRYLLADLATAACLIALNLKYWRHIWPVR